MKLIDGQVPKGSDVHLVLDNYGTHNHPNVKVWLAKHRRFRELTDKAIRRGVFRSVEHLIDTIDDYLETHNADPKPFTWTASAESIIEKVERGRAVLKQASGQ